MKPFLVIVLFGLIFGPSIHAQAAAGNDGGHGGGAFICPDPAKSQFLDLYEARESRADGGMGLNIPRSFAPVETQIQEAFKKLNPETTLYTRMLSTYRKVRGAGLHPVPAGRQLAWPSDEHNKYAPAGCSQRGIIIFHDEDNSMDIDLDALNSLPPQEQAAAWVHETVYKFLRDTQNDRRSRSPVIWVSDSVNARKVVGYLFSDLKPIQYNLYFAGLNPQAGRPHIEGGMVVVSYAGERAPDLNYKILINPDPTRDQNCKLPEQLHVPTSGVIKANDYGYYPTYEEGRYECGRRDGATTCSIPNWLRLFGQESTWRSKSRRCPFTLVLSDSFGNQTELNFSGLIDHDFDEFRMFLWSVPQLP